MISSGSNFHPDFYQGIAINQSSGGDCVELSILFGMREAETGSTRSLITEIMLRLRQAIPPKYLIDGRLL